MNNPSYKKFSDRLQEYRSAVECSKEVNISKLAEKLGWPRSVVSLFKYKFAILKEEQVSILDEADFDIDDEILGAVCLCPENSRIEMLRRLKEMHQVANPFELMEQIMLSHQEKHPLENLSRTYWKEIANYLRDRGIERYPFNKKAIHFIGSIGKKGFATQTTRQKDWIIDLMRADKNGFELAGIFNNELLIRKGLEKDYEIINGFYACL